MSKLPASEEAKQRVIELYPFAHCYPQDYGAQQRFIVADSQNWDCRSIGKSTSADAAWIDAASRLPAVSEDQLDTLLKNVKPATKEELREQGENLAKNYRPGPRQAVPFKPVSEDGIGSDDERPCGLQGNWCYVHHCYPATCKQMGHGQYGNKVLKERLAEGAGVPHKHNDEFLLGFAMALAVVNRQHDQPTMIKDAMEGYGITVLMLKNAGVEDYDLKEIRKCMK